MDDFLTTKQVADYLHVTEKTVRDLIARKEIEAYRIGRAWRIKKIHLDEYIKQQSNLNGKEDN